MKNDHSGDAPETSVEKQTLEALQTITKYLACIDHNIGIITKISKDDERQKRLARDFQKNIAEMRNKL